MNQREKRKLAKLMNRLTEESTAEWTTTHITLNGGLLQIKSKDEDWTEVDDKTALLFLSQHIESTMSWTRDAITLYTEVTGNGRETKGS